MCARSLLLIALTIAFHLTTRYDWWFGGTFDPWRIFTALIVWRQPGNRYGWLWCAPGLGMTVRGAAYAYQIWALYVAPYQPGGLEAAWVGTVMDALIWGLVPLLLLLFPDGRGPVAGLATGDLGDLGRLRGVDASAAVAPGEMNGWPMWPSRWPQPLSSSSGGI